MFGASVINCSLRDALAKFIFAQHLISIFNFLLQSARQFVRTPTLFDDEMRNSILRLRRFVTRFVAEFSFENKKHDCNSRRFAMTSKEIFFRWDLPQRISCSRFPLNKTFAAVWKPAVNWYFFSEKNRSLSFRKMLFPRKFSRFAIPKSIAIV